MKNIKNVSIVGVGLIGGSIGLALRKIKRNIRVTGIGRNTVKLARAKKAGAVEKFTTDFVEGVKDADLIIIAVPVSKTSEMIKKLIDGIKTGTIVIDVGSVKGKVVKEAERLLTGKGHFVGTHPMAGSERTGVENAKAGLFQGSTCIITETRKTDKDALNAVRALWKAVGANVLILDPETHDRLVAEVSHLNHVLAFALASQVGENHRRNEDISKIAAGSYNDMTRIATSSSGIWADICIDNRVALLKSISNYEKKLTILKTLINKKDKSALIKKFDRAKKSREDIIRCQK